jgi:xylulokinase
VSELMLGIDVGTASSKAVLARPDGSVVATARRDHRLSLPRPGWAEHDAEAVWWADVVALCRELTADGPPPAGVCVSGIGPCVLAADAAGRPLRPAILYGIDTRATREIDELRERLGDDEIVRRGGSPLTTQAVGPKLRWLERHEPEVWSRMRRLLMASSLAVLRLTGEYVLDHHSASQCDPLYDLEASTWIDEWAAEIAPDLELPRLLWPGEEAGRVTAAGADATGLPAGTPVMAGTIDAWAESLAVGVRDPGEAMLMYGSTMFLVAGVDRPVRSPSFWATAGALAGTWCLAGGLATSGSLVAWLGELASEHDLGALHAQAAAVPPGAEGLLALPYFAGERTPLFDPNARGTICGLTLRHGRGHLCRALLEGTAFAVRHNLEQMAAAGVRADRLVAVGGGARDALWPQIVSDVLGEPQTACHETVGAAYGDAFLAAVGSGLLSAEAPWGAEGSPVEPDRATGAHYEELYGLYRDLYPATRAHAHTLAAIQARDADPAPPPEEEGAACTHTAAGD